MAVATRPVAALDKVVAEDTAYSPPLGTTVTCRTSLDPGFILKFEEVAELLFGGQPAFIYSGGKAERNLRQWQWTM